MGKTKNTFTVLVFIEFYTKIMVIYSTFCGAQIEWRLAPSWMPSKKYIRRTECNDQRLSCCPQHASTHQFWLTAAENIPWHSRSLRGGPGRPDEKFEEAALLRRSIAQGLSLWLSLEWNHSWATLRPSLIFCLWESGYYWPPAPCWRMWGSPCLRWSLFSEPDNICNVLSGREW